MLQTSMRAPRPCSCQWRPASTSPHPTSGTELRSFGRISIPAPARRVKVQSAQTSFYAVLEVAEDATIEQIKAAYKRKARTTHPDVNPDSAAEEAFMLVRRAYTTLSTPELRADHDARLGLATARARDPRFARFERWRREVVPDLRIQLGYWAQSVDIVVAEWSAGREQRQRRMEALRAGFASSLQQLQREQQHAQLLQQQQHAQQQQSAGSTSPVHSTATPPSSQPPGPTTAPSSTAAAAPGPTASSSAPTTAALPSHNAASVARTFDTVTATDTTSRPHSSTPPTTTNTADPTASTTPSGYTAPVPVPTTHATNTVSTGYSGVDAAPDPLTACERALAALRDELRGFGADTSDGTARVQREVDKRYEQVSTRYPAYPDIVWYDVWEEVSGEWLSRGWVEARACDDASVRWAAAVEEMQQQLLRAAPHAQVYSQVGAAAAGRFNG